jgi:hypothetical protein
MIGAHQEASAFAGGFKGYFCRERNFLRPICAFLIPARGGLPRSPRLRFSRRKGKLLGLFVTTLDKQYAALAAAAGN